MKKVIYTFLVIVLLLNTIACGQAGETPAANDSLTWQEQYDLGFRYLSESNYEEAIIAFTAAIEIDPKQALAYVGRGDVYTIMAEQSQDTLDAITFLEKAILDYEEALALGNAQIEATLETSRTNLQRIKGQREAQSKLEDLYTYFEENNIEGAKILMRQREYTELSASLTDGFYYFDNGTGVGLAVYPNNYYYYGQWENGVRSGHGLWICALFADREDRESYVYDGEWANDLPNGNGMIIVNRYPDKIELEPGHSTSVTTEISGTFADGLYHGTIYEIWHMNTGEVHAWTPITAINGVYQVIDYDGGRKIVAYDQANRNTELYSNGNIKAIGGLNIES